MWEVLEIECRGQGTSKHEGVDGGERSEVVRYTQSDLEQGGWKLYPIFPRWKVFYKKRAEHPRCTDVYNFNFLTLFRNGRTARGHYAP